MKTIAGLHLGIENNIDLLIKQIYKRYEKYKSGESAQKLCERIKDDLLEKQAKLDIKPVAECSCGSTFHKEIMMDCIIPCVHTITQETEISIELPHLDENKFLKSTDFKPVKSPLTGLLKDTNKDKDLIDEPEYMSYSEINEALIRNRNFFSFYNQALTNEDLEEIIRVSTIEAFKLGLNIANVDDFIKFLMMDYLLNNCNVDLLENNKEINLGRYFALYKK